MVFLQNQLDNLTAPKKPLSKGAFFFGVIMLDSLFVVKEKT